MDLNTALLGVVIVLLLLRWPVVQTSTRAARLERKIDVIIKHLGIDMGTLVHREVLALVQAGKKIEAIKLHREMTGESLRRSKDYVEGIQLEKMA